MDFAPTEEQEAVRSAASDVLSRVSGSRIDAEPPPTGDEWFDRATWARLASSNLLGLNLAEDVDGSGLGLLETGVLLEEMGRHLARVPGIATLGVAAPAVDAFGSAELRAGVLPRVVTGESVLTFALVEPDSYDPTVLTTTATRTDSGWTVTGEKTCVPFAAQADLVIVPAATASGEIVVLAVDPTASGVVLAAQETTNGQPESSLRMDAVAVEDTHRLGADVPGLELLAWLVDRAVLATCAVQLGVIEQALAMTAAYTSTREQFGKPIATFQAVALRAADAYIAVDCVRNTLLQAAWLVSEGRDVGRAIDVAKFWASEGAETVTAAAQQLHGGIGVDLDYPLYRYTLWCKRNELSLGAGHAHLASIGAAIASSA